MRLAVGGEIGSTSRKMQVFDQQNLIRDLEADGADTLYRLVRDLEAERLQFGFRF
jgi:hypothetical protein